MFKFPFINLFLAIYRTACDKIAIIATKRPAAEQGALQPNMTYADGVGYVSGMKTEAKGHSRLGGN
jgi:hypothetical protein